MKSNDLSPKSPANEANPEPVDLVGLAVAVNDTANFAEFAGLPMPPSTPYPVFSYLSGLLEQLADRAVLDSLPTAAALVGSKQALRQRDWGRCKRLLKTCALPAHELNFVLEALRRSQIEWGEEGGDDGNPEKRA